MTPVGLAVSRPRGAAPSPRRGIVRESARRWARCSRRMRPSTIQMIRPASATPATNTSEVATGGSPSNRGRTSAPQTKNAATAAAIASISLLAGGFWRTRSAAPQERGGGKERQDAEHGSDDGPCMPSAVGAGEDEPDHAEDEGDAAEEDRERQRQEHQPSVVRVRRPRQDEDDRGRQDPDDRHGGGGDSASEGAATGQRRDLSHGAILAITRPRRGRAPAGRGGSPSFPHPRRIAPDGDDSTPIGRRVLLATSCTSSQL
ncbi:unnamed protein product [Penicillium discolor]